MKSTLHTIGCVILCLFFATFSPAQPILDFIPIPNIAGLSQPVKITNANDGTNRLFICEKGGRIKIYDLNTNTLLATPFLNISGKISTVSERGLLGLAFHPEFGQTQSSNNRYFYVNYTASNGTTNVARFEVSATDPNVADINSEFTIITIAQPYANHNAGDLAFSPIDNYLYIPLGDGGSGGDPQDLAQDLTQRLGKLLRIDVNGGSPYAIPADNPYVGNTNNIPEEIWAVGLRNPWRFSFDSAGNMFIADVGQGLWEEVNFQPFNSTGKENYGWDCREGKHNFNNSAPECNGLTLADFTEPIFEYKHKVKGGGESITGGYRYEGTEFPLLKDYYVVGDYEYGNFWTLRQNQDNTWTASEADSIPAGDRVTTFGEDENGELYLATIGGNLFQVGTSGFVPTELLSFTAKSTAKGIQLHWTTGSEQNVSHFEIQKGKGANVLQTIAQVKANGNTTSNSTYSFLDESPYEKNNYYRLRTVDIDGSYKESSILIVKFDKTVQSPIAMYPNPNNGTFRLVLEGNKKNVPITINIIDITGKAIYQKQFTDIALPFDYPIQMNNLAKGIYMMEVNINGEIYTEKLILESK